MNMAILTERAKADERRENKRKYLESKDRQQDRFQKLRNYSYTAPRSQAPMQYRTQSQVTSSQAPNTQFRNLNTMKAPQNKASQVTTNNNNARAYFNCLETGYYIANCPYAKTKPAALVFSNSVNGPRPPVSGANRVPIGSNNKATTTAASNLMDEPASTTSTHRWLRVHKEWYLVSS